MGNDRQNAKARASTEATTRGDLFVPPLSPRDSDKDGAPTLVCWDDGGFGGNFGVLGFLSSFPDLGQGLNG